MIRVENYPNAYKEVFVILNNMDEEYVKKIPQDFMNIVIKNMNNDYEFELDKNIDFEEQSLLKETKCILAYIFIHYWGTKEQVTKIKQKFKQDIMEWEQSKQKYNSNELFKNSKYQNKEKKEEIQMIEYKKENFFVKFINKIKSWFKR